jgi:ElaB/YqjD/DUF883 family membrane-anchored ribosome-binding protein
VKKREKIQFGGGGLPGDNAETHPSFGVVSLSRGQWSGGGVQLFGSPLEAHQTTIALRVCRADRSHALGSEWIHGRDAIVEVLLSPMQYAELLTTMNVGQGVPCTIRHVQGEDIPELPRLTTERANVKDEFKHEMRDLGDRLDKFASEATEILTKRGDIKKTEREALHQRIKMLIQDVRSNMPFMLEQFDKATDRVTTAAKADIDAFVTTAVTMLGFDKLEELRAALASAKPSAPPAIEAADEPRERGVYLEGDGSARGAFRSPHDRCLGNCSRGGDGPPCGKWGCQG